MNVTFDSFYQRVRQKTDISTQLALARALGVNRSAVTQAKQRDSVPQKWILALARRYALSPDWLEFGTGLPQAERTTPPAAADALRTGNQGPGPVCFVPKVAARLCAGGGSFEFEALPVSEHPFPRPWLARMGRPEAMVFMDVVGDSMEPEIRDGDMVLVDQSKKDASFRNIMAVGLEDAIYIKRVERRSSGIVLRSANPSYADVDVQGDELEFFRIIGQIVWLCRDFR